MKNLGKRTMSFGQSIEYLTIIYYRYCLHSYTHDQVRISAYIQLQINYIHDIPKIRRVMDQVWVKLGCPAISGCNLGQQAAGLGWAYRCIPGIPPKMAVFIGKTRETWWLPNGWNGVFYFQIKRLHSGVFVTW